jgi:hypothetical protein
MPPHVFHRGFLEFGDYRYLKVAALLVLGSIVAYARDSTVLGPSGGTRVGYTLGTIGAVLILWLMWFGIRKRRYGSRLGTLQGWLSAHVYLGVSLIVVATLHTGFQAGWNVHTLAYVLMLIVIASGFYGTYAYVRYPTLVAEVLGDETLDSIFLKLPGLDLEARRLALNLPDEVNRAVLEASQRTNVGGGVLAQLRGTDPSCPTTAALNLVKAKGPDLKGEDARKNHELFAVLLRKESLLERARQAVMYKARLDVWLYAHVPLSFALLAALAAHVLSVFIYRS